MTLEKPFLFVLLVVSLPSSPAFILLDDLLARIQHALALSRDRDALHAPFSDLGSLFEPGEVGHDAVAGLLSPEVCTPSRSGTW